MNRLKNYKRIEKTKEDAELAKAEMQAVLDRYLQDLKEKFVESTLHSYHNSMMEIERRKLAERAEMPLPRIDHFIHGILNYSFTKLHKGDKLKAYEIMENIKDELVNIKVIS